MSRHGQRVRSAHTAASASEFEGGVAGNDYTINQRVERVVLRTPSGKDGPTIFRPLPIPDVDDPTDQQLEPGRIYAMKRGVGHWLAIVDAAYYIGVKNGGERCTFNLYHPALSSEEKQRNPYQHFYWTAWRANDAAKKSGALRGWNPAWKQLFDRPDDTRGGFSAAFTAPQKLYTCQAAFLRHRKETYVGPQRTTMFGLDPSDPLPLLRLNQRLGGRLLDLYDRPRLVNGQPAPMDEENPSSAFMYGDPVGYFNPATETLDGGVFVYLSDMGFSPMPPALAPHSTLILPKPVPKDPSKPLRTDTKGYEAAVMDRCLIAGQTVFPSLPAAQGRVVRARAHYLLPDENNPDTDAKSLLNFISIEQQCELIARAARPVSGMLAFCWYDRPDFMTDAVRAIITNRASMVMPGQPLPGDAPAGYPGQAPPPYGQPSGYPAQPAYAAPPFQPGYGQPRAQPGYPSAQFQPGHGQPQSGHGEPAYGQPDAYGQPAAADPGWGPPPQNGSVPPGTDRMMAGWEQPAAAPGYGPAPGAPAWNGASAVAGEFNPNELAGYDFGAAAPAGGDLFPPADFAGRAFGEQGFDGQPDGSVPGDQFGGEPATGFGDGFAAAQDFGADEQVDYGQPADSGAFGETPTPPPYGGAPAPYSAPAPHGAPAPYGAPAQGYGHLQPHAFQPMGGQQPAVNREQIERDMARMRQSQTAAGAGAGPAAEPGRTSQAPQVAPPPVAAQPVPQPGPPMAGPRSAASRAGGPPPAPAAAAAPAARSRRPPATAQPQPAAAKSRNGAVKPAAASPVPTAAATKPPPAKRRK